MQVYEDIVRWMYDPSQKFLPAGQKEFADGADPWLIAYARVHGYCVVTQETHKPEKRNKVPIPNVCLAFNVPYVDTFTMMRKPSVAI